MSIYICIYRERERSSFPLDDRVALDAADACFPYIFPLNYHIYIYIYI